MTGEPLNIVAWNIAHREDAWRLLVDSRADIALLQEAGPPPSEVAAKIKTDAAPWQTAASQRWRTAVVQISEQAQVHWLTVKPFVDACSGELGASRSGTIAAARVAPLLGEPFIVAFDLCCLGKANGQAATLVRRCIRASADLRLVSFH